MDKCAIVKPSKVSPTLHTCVCVCARSHASLCVCSCMHAVFVRPRFGFLVKGERMCPHNGSRLFAGGVGEGGRGQVWATIQLLPKFVISSRSHWSYVTKKRLHRARSINVPLCV